MQRQGTIPFFPSMTYLMRANRGSALVTVSQFLEAVGMFRKMGSECFEPVQAISLVSTAADACTLRGIEAKSGEARENEGYTKRPRAYSGL